MLVLRVTIEEGKPSLQFLAKSKVHFGKGNVQDVKRAINLLTINTKDVDYGIRTIFLRCVELLYPFQHGNCLMILPHVLAMSLDLRQSCSNIWVGALGLRQM